MIQQFRKLRLPQKVQVVGGCVWVLIIFATLGWAFASTIYQRATGTISPIERSVGHGGSIVAFREPVQGQMIQEELIFYDNNPAHTIPRAAYRGPVDWEVRRTPYEVRNVQLREDEWAVVRSLQQTWCQSRSSRALQEQYATPPPAPETAFIEVAVQCDGLFGRLHTFTIPITNVPPEIDMLFSFVPRVNP